jgi:hypothetical protein
MKNLNELNDYRAVQEEIRSYGVMGDDKGGLFLIPHKGDMIKVIASSDYGWDHVSISLPDRIPNWYEMEYIKRLFFKENEIAIEYHMPTKDHINVHPYVLHLWRPINKKIPVPPKLFV